MSERNYWSEESLQKYREDLIRQRMELNPVTDSYYIKFIDKEIDNLPDHYLESQVDFKKSKQVHKDNSPKNSFRDNAVFIISLAIPIVIGVVTLVLSLASFIYNIYSSFEPMVEFLTKIGSGYWFVGLIIVPFAIISLIQIFRGAVLLLNDDADTFGLDDKRKDWKASLYIVINLLGYIALCIFIKRM